MATQNGQIFSFESQITELKARLQAAESLSEERAAKISALEQTIRERNETIQQLEEKSREDENLRRNLHNQIQELKGNIRVFCRVRPGGSQGTVPFFSFSHLFFKLVLFLTLNIADEEPNFAFPANTDNRALEVAYNTVRK